MPKRYTSPERCKTKVPYSSREEAKALLRRVGGGNMRVYCCNVCGSFHIGSGGKSGNERSERKSQCYGTGKRKEAA